MLLALCWWLLGWLWVLCDAAARIVFLLGLVRRIRHRPAAG